MAKSNPQRIPVVPGIKFRLSSRDPERTFTDAEGNTRKERGVFELSFKDAQGHQRRRRVEGGITAAQSALNLEHAARNRHAPTSDPRLKFGTAADQWWEARAKNQRPATQSAYSAGLKHLRREFGNKRLTDITPAAVAAFVDRQRRHGLKGWTIKGQLTVLSSVYKYASRHLGYTGTSPVTLLDRVERPNTEDERDKRILTPDELARLIAALDEHYRLLFELAAETGARLSEALGLVWGEIDLDAATVTFTHQLDRKGKRVPLKTKRSRRCLEITPILVGKLREAKVGAAASGKYDLVFVTRRTSKPHDQRNVGGRVLERAVKRAGLEATERDGQVLEHAPTFHSLRHSHGSALIASGWDIEEVSARLGHSNVATTQRIYVHAYDAAKRSEQRRNRLAALYAPGEGMTAGAIVTALPNKGPA
jgi:integrase